MMLRKLTKNHRKITIAAVYAPLTSAFIFEKSKSSCELVFEEHIKILQQLPFWECIIGYFVSALSIRMITDHFLALLMSMMKLVGILDIRIKSRFHRWPTSSFWYSR